MFNCLEMVSSSCLMSAICSSGVFIISALFAWRPSGVCFCRIAQINGGECTGTCSNNEEICWAYEFLLG